MHVVSPDERYKQPKMGFANRAAETHFTYALQMITVQHYETQSASDFICFPPRKNCKPKQTAHAFTVNGAALRNT